LEAEIVEIEAALDAEADGVAELEDIMFPCTFQFMDLSTLKASGVILLIS